MQGTAQLRAALDAPGVTVIHAVADAFTALIAARAGHSAAVLDATAVSNNLLGRPDGGFLSLTEMEFVLSRASRIAPIPLIVDAGNGYGNAINTVHAMRTLERAGASGIIIADGVSASRGSDGRLPWVPVLSTEEMAGKIKAAVDTRKDPNLLVIATSQAAAAEGIDAVIERGNRYAQAGADGFFVDATDALGAEVLARVGREVAIAYRFAEAGEHVRAGSSLEALAALGFAGAWQGLTLVKAQAFAILHFLDDYRQRGNDADLALLKMLEGSPFEDWYQYTGFDEIRALEERYLPADEVSRRYGGAHSAQYYQPKQGTEK